jgi:hypothetical protein
MLIKRAVGLKSVASRLFVRLDWTVIWPRQSVQATMSGSKALMLFTCQLQCGFETCMRVLLRGSYYRTGLRDDF